jgi:hypothetical protein
VIADRGMISTKTVAELEARQFLHVLVLEVGPVFARFVFYGQSFIAVPPVPPFGTTIIIVMCLQYHWSHPVTGLYCLRE